MDRGTAPQGLRRGGQVFNGLLLALEGTVDTILAAVITVISTTLLAWLIGTRVSYGWDEVKRRRECDLAALNSFYRCYGTYFSAWKMWEIYLANSAVKEGERFPVNDEMAWNILREAENAAIGFEAILVRLVSEYASFQEDQFLLASFREAAQSLREAIRDGRSLTWKAQPHSPRDGPPSPMTREQRLLDYRKYRAFKALCEYVALKLAHGSHSTRAASHGPGGSSWKSALLLGLRPPRNIDQNTAIAALIQITQTEGIGGHWYEIAEKSFALPAVM
jgi:hypothetical protein